MVDFMNIGRIRALVMPWVETAKAYFSDETCSNFMNRNIAENKLKLDAGDINFAQAKDYLKMLGATAPHHRGYNGECLSIVARAEGSLDALAKR